MQILLIPIIAGAILGGFLLILTLLGKIISHPLPLLARLEGVIAKRPPASHEELFEAAPALLTPAERSLFGVLKQALGSEYLLFAKVRLADIISPDKSLVRARRMAAFNRICAKHADFVLCDPATLRVIGIIELDDRSHSLPDRQQRDCFVDGALKAARIPVLRIAARKFYTPSEVRQQVSDMLGARPICLAP
jgi:hypothetical protein